AAVTMRETPSPSCRAIDTDPERFFGGAVGGVVIAVGTGPEIFAAASAADSAAAIIAVRRGGTNGSARSPSIVNRRARTGGESAARVGMAAVFGARTQSMTIRNGE